METTKLKKFAQFARRNLREQVTAKLKLALTEGSAAQRESAEAIKKLEEAIKAHGKEQVIERVAYIWFNRFCALRFMDVNRYTRIGVVSPTEGKFQPEILAEAKMGHIDEDMVHDKVRQQIFALLDGKAPSRDPQGEAYRLLVVAACNYWNTAMPFLFQRIDDYTELLMPDDLLSGNSILAYTREAMTPDACEDVEVIGWLYQFYISEKKDEVFDGLKKNNKITPENIPAATQIFTPHWIVRYLVENSLGRLWLLNRPQSRIFTNMKELGEDCYYIEPTALETDFLKISSPEEIKICDPACGSGHMLTYAFDLLYAIYEEEGYELAEIPEKILTNNLYGIEIDERAGELAAFALTMKARAKQRRFFNKSVKPNICVLENVHFDGDELKNYMDFVGRDLFTAPLQTTLHQFEEADNFGSLIRPDVTDVDGMRRILESQDVSGQLFLGETHRKVLQVLHQADHLDQKYHVVVANPPYMGASGMNNQLKKYLNAKYPNGRSDAMTAFIYACTRLIQKNGLLGMVTMDGWMFLSTYEKFRSDVLHEAPILTMVHVGWNCFPDGHVYNRGTAFVQKLTSDNISGVFLNLSNAPASTDKNELFLAKLSKGTDLFKRSTADFEKIPGAPISYWAPKNLFEVFASNPSFNENLEPREGLTTGKNETYVRYSYEVERNRVSRSSQNRKEATASGKKWFPYNKGGDYRKWYGNDVYVINWENDGHALQNTMHPGGKRIWAHNFNLDFIFRPSVSWSDITTRGLSARLFRAGFIFDATGLSAFNRNVGDYEELSCAICNSVVGAYLAPMLNPTLHFKSGDFAEMPMVTPRNAAWEKNVKTLYSTAKSDWDAYETSWDFTTLPLLSPEYIGKTLNSIYATLRTQWQGMTDEVKLLEEENNRIFIDAYGLEEELKPRVPQKKITLTCNPAYRYTGDNNPEELEQKLLADTMRELVSYAVGCMFGRYALDKPGLILANLGETIEDYLKRVPEPSFSADDDNVIPMLEDDWFTDDIAGRFRQFLRVAFGDEHYEENLQFVEQGLNTKGKRNYGIRDYFLSEFYNDHVRRYKKRPIYWLFSSSKGSFNALIYMHRYRPDTVSVVLNDYLREFRTKLTSHKNHLEAVSISGSASQGEKTKALKEIEKVSKMITEMEEYEREVLYPLATEQVTIDLDDGVKVNYPKFGTALKKITGLS